MTRHCERRRSAAIRPHTADPSLRATKERGNRNDNINTNPMERGGYIYILTNKNHTVLYVGVTSNLGNRLYEHRTGKYQTSFTFKYNVKELVYFEEFLSIEEAIYREKQLKAGSRQKKLDLINRLNPEWKDLSSSIV
jgi:putative endonuclease